MADVECLPYEAKEINPAEVQELNKYFSGVISPCSKRYGSQGYLLPNVFEEVGREIYKMDVRAEDIFIVTFPKSGTTWTQDMIWLIANNFDYEKAIEIPLNVRYPFIDVAFFLNPDIVALMTQDEKLKQAGDALAILSLEEIAALPDQRFLKSHLPLSLLPPQLVDITKVVYVARDPRDVVVSFYHHSLLMKLVQDDMPFKDYWKLFIKDLVPWTPYFPHIKEAWDLRDHPNMLFMFYEELSKDLPACVRRVAKFLGKDITEDQVDRLCDHLNIKNFKNNKSVNMKEVSFFNQKESFIRKGKVGGWRDYFDKEMTKEAEEWIEKHLQDTDLRFPQQ